MATCWQHASSAGRRFLLAKGGVLPISAGMKKAVLFLLLSMLALVALTGCQTTQRGGASSFAFDPPAKQPRNPSNVQVKLSTGAQRLYVVEGNDVLLATPVSVGKAASPTPHGNYKIYLKTANRRRISNPGSGYPMTYWMEFKPAYGMHWGFVKPYPSTMGCVRMPLKAAQKTFNLVRSGTPINISTSQPWDATVGKSLPKLDDSHLPDPPMSYMLSPQVFADARQGKLWRF
jgi:hypothetical protein